MNRRPLVVELGKLDREIPASDTVRSIQRPPPGVAGGAHVRLQGDENGLPATSGSLVHLQSSSEAEVHLWIPERSSEMTEICDWQQLLPCSERCHPQQVRFWAL